MHSNKPQKKVAIFLPLSLSVLIIHTLRMKPFSFWSRTEEMHEANNATERPVRRKERSKARWWPINVLKKMCLFGNVAYLRIRYVQACLRPPKAKISRILPSNLSKCCFYVRLWSGGKVRKYCRSRKNVMLQNGNLVAEVGFDTGEKKPSKVS